MKFIDEATIKIKAGNGGNGSGSFRREKFIPKGGPDGGDGGDGGSIYLRGNAQINTLVDFRYQKFYQADNGEAGKGSNCTGKSGEDYYIDVPLGTIVAEAETGESIGDLTHAGQTLLVARGGFHGLGNLRYKSSVNRAPRQFTKGTPGETRTLKLELKLLADAGLLGMPNAGKSTLIRSMSAAKPKVADYPFTTLHPNLGVVRIDANRSFVMADIPGLIEGASEGAGLGIQFLRHLSRNRLLLHLVDVVPFDGSSPVDSAKQIVRELHNYSEELAGKPRWLVFNKLDLLPSEQQDAVCQSIIDALEWQGPVFRISAIRSQGTRELGFAMMEFLETLKKAEIKKETIEEPLEEPVNPEDQAGELDKPEV